MKRRSESGFAVLLIFALAAIIAITLYMALPRVAFESQRDKEQALIDRGEQYKRAIQLYVRKNKRWPAKVEDLENTNGVRFLRRRYVDPMTGKDEWRPIHVGPNGVLTDSLIKKDKKDGKDAKPVDNFIAELAPISGGSNDPQANANPGLRKRVSDTAPQGAPDGGGGSLVPPPDGSQPGLNQFGSNQPSLNQPGLNQQGLNQPGLNQPGFNQPGLNQPGPNGLPQQLQRLGTSAAPPVNSQTGGISVFGGIGSVATPTPLPGNNPGVPNPNQPIGVGQPNPGNAAQLIQNLLTAPRPGGAPSNTGTPIGQVQGGGIAGFASKFEGEAIKVYNEQTEYQKWEFVYDMSKDPLMSGQTGPNVAGQNGANGQPQTGQIPTTTGPPATVK